MTPRVQMNLIATENKLWLSSAFEKKACTAHNTFHVFQSDHSNPIICPDFPKFSLTALLLCRYANAGQWPRNYCVQRWHPLQLVSYSPVPPDMFHRYFKNIIHSVLWIITSERIVFSNWPGHNIHLRTVYCSTAVRICCYTTYTVHHPDAHSFPTALVLKRNPNLTTLYLSCCSIGDDAACELMEGVRDHPSLETLFLYGNALGERVKSAVAEVRKRNKTVSIFGL